MTKLIPIVVMARKSSLTLRLITPSSPPAAAVTSIAAGRLSQKLIPAFVISAAVYAPIPKKAAWPMADCPAYPVMIFRLSASSAKIAIFTATVII